MGTAGSLAPWAVVMWPIGFVGAAARYPGGTPPVNVAAAPRVVTAAAGPVPAGAVGAVAQRGDRGRVRGVVMRPIGVVGAATRDPGGTPPVNVAAAPRVVTAAAGPLPAGAVGAVAPGVVTVARGAGGVVTIVAGARGVVTVA